MKPEMVEIKLKLGCIEVEMTLEDAKELQRVLNETFGQPPTVWYPVLPYTPFIPGPTWEITYTSGTKIYGGTT